MPTYEEALAANPSAFVDYAGEMEASGTDLGDHQTAYDATVTDINAEWQDRANAAFNEDVALVDAHVSDVRSQVADASGLLGAGGSQMAAMVERLKAVDAAYRGAGFTVQPAPKVELGAVHWAAIAAAGPFGPMLQALFQARADEGTVQLQTGLAVLTVTDVATGAALTAAAAALQPIEDKGDPGADEDSRDADMQQISQEIETEPERAGRKADEADREEQDEEDGTDDEEERRKKAEEDEQDSKDEDESEKDGDLEKPRAEDPAAPPVQPAAPDLGGADPGLDPGDLATPEAPDYEGLLDPSEFEPSDFDPSELEPSALDAGDPSSGGLAGGGLGGGGLGGSPSGPGDLPSSSPGSTAPVSGIVSGPGSPAAAATSGTGGRPGLSGGMMGAPGARGAANPDDEVERESLLTEDPEEDVWGIGTAENNPYVDYQEERPEATDPPEPPRLDDLPPFTLPGFDLPPAGRP